MRTVYAAVVACLCCHVSCAWADESPRMHCFSSADFVNWRAPDTKTVYLRISGGRIYRIDLARECRSLRFPDSRLFLKIRGGHVVCSALDLELKASQGFADFPEPCFAKAMTELSPAAAEALPKNAKP